MHIRIADEMGPFDEAAVSLFRAQRHAESRMRALLPRQDRPSFDVTLQWLRENAHLTDNPWMWAWLGERGDDFVPGDGAWSPEEGGV